MEDVEGLGVDRTISDILPQELLLTLFTFLPVKDLCSGVGIACKYWHAITEDEYLWKQLAIREPAHKPSFYLLSVPFLEEGHPFPLDDVNKQKENRKKLPDVPFCDVIYKTACQRGWTWKDLFRCKNVLVTKEKPTPMLGTICKSTLNTSEKFDKVYEYYGEIGGSNALNRRHGFGICIWKTGSIYIGQWKDGKREGSGKLFWKEGGYYSGCWFEGYRHGQGKLVTRNHFVFEGQWTRNELQNEGYKFWLEDSKLEEYKGMFRNTKARGLGNRSYANGSAKYFGFYWKDRRVGFGVYKWKNGDEFVGLWNVGRVEGRFIEKATGREFDQHWQEAEHMDTEKRRNVKEVEILEEDKKLCDGFALVERKAAIFAKRYSGYFSKAQLLELAKEQI